MEKILLKIYEISNYDYVLYDESNLKKHNLNLEFLLKDYKVIIGDKILISLKLLSQDDEEYSSNYTFGYLDSQYGKAINKINEEEIIILITGDKEIYLKRLYG